MQTKLRLLIPCILFGFLVFWSIQAAGQEWTEAQKEVWSVIETRWEKLKQGDYKFLENGIHNDALMWLHDKNAPINKPVMTSEYDRWINYAKPVTYELKPYAIQLFGDIANVLFAYRWKAERKFSGHSRTLITLKKEDGKWLIISSLSVSCEKLPHCLDF